MRLISLVLILALSVIPTSAQERSRQIVGIVTDPRGAVIPSVLIIVSKPGNIDALLKVTTTTNGSFQIVDLAPGKYVLKISAFGDSVERLVAVSEENATELNLVLGLGCNGITGSDESVPDTERADIINDALSNALRSLHVLETKLREPLIISTENIKSKWLANFRAAQLRLMTKKEIQRKADSSGDFLYTSFSGVRISSRCVAIDIDNTWADRKNSRILHMDGGGITYEFRKIDGKWTMKTVGGWVS